jgi:hypothetical protein
LKNYSPIEAGQTKPQKNQGERVDTISQIFALFKLNYHNQFHKAFSNTSELNSIKRLWLESLSEFDVDILLAAAKSIVAASEYLPTLKTMIQHCEEAAKSGYPDVRLAYVEACCSASPKAEQTWSHPLVYHTGRELGWHFLHSTQEDIAFPAFKQVYAELMKKARHGLELKMPELLELEKPESKPASEETRKHYISKLNSLFD